MKKNRCYNLGMVY